jgi:hypothetical protein
VCNPGIPTRPRIRTKEGAAVGAEAEMNVPNPPVQTTPGAVTSPAPSVSDH